MAYIHFERRDFISQLSLLPLLGLQLTLKKEYCFRSYLGTVDQLSLLRLASAESLLHIRIGIEMLSKLALLEMQQLLALPFKLLFLGNICCIFLEFPLEPADSFAVLLNLPQKGVYLLLMPLVVLPHGICLLLPAMRLLDQLSIVFPCLLQLGLEDLHLFLHAHDL